MNIAEYTQIVPAIAHAISIQSKYSSKCSLNTDKMKTAIKPKLIAHKPTSPFCNIATMQTNAQINAPKMWCMNLSCPIFPKKSSNFLILFMFK